MDTRSTILVGTLGFLSLASVNPMALAQSDSSSSAAAGDPATCSALLDAKHAEMMARMEEHFALRKEAMNAKHEAVKAALALTDATARQEALQVAREAFHQKMMGTMPQRKEMKEATEDLETACAGLLPMKGGKGLRMFHGFRGHHGGEWMGR